MITEPAMSQRLTRRNLHGVWAAITTPFDGNDRFDEGAFRENIRRLHAAGVHGIYTTDSDGEFYAIEIDEFKQIVRVFADETQRLGFPTMVGVTWCNTRGMLERLQFAASCGILGAHVGHPFFMPMTPESYTAFWQDVCRAVPESFALIHYNTPRVHNYQHGPDYVALAGQVPNLIGSKHVGADVPDFLTLIASTPHLSHFTGEHAFTPFMLLGARGVYSWLTSFNPRYVLDWYDDCVNQRWEQAVYRQQRVHAFSQAKRVLAGSGNLHGILNKGMGVVSPFLVGGNSTRRPYLPVSDDLIEQFRRVVEEQFQDLVWTP
jgi:dihydrodipicolinate synthase/N-acetylneuraminate lyase